MKEKATLDKIEAAMDAFGRERLRWLMGKGDVLIQRGDLTEEHLEELLKKTVRDEIERSYIAKQLENAHSTISQISKATRIDKERVVWNLLAMMKWNRVEIVGQEGAEYLYALKGV